MRKPDELRTALVAALPRLANDPDKIRMWVDQGGIATRATPTLAFEYRYRLNVLLLDFTEDPDAAVVPTLIWLRTAQPSAAGDFTTNDKALSFTVDILDDSTVDLHLELQLTEAVGVRPKHGGEGYVVTHFAEPVMYGHEPIADVLLKSIWLEGEDRPLVPFALP